jgi:protein disulfide-isomerase-like protein
MWKVLLLAFAAVVALVAADSDVVILTSKNFEHLTQASSGATTGDWLVEFYAPWCGHCKKLEPIYEDVAKRLKGEVNVAKVDVPANRELGTRFDIKGFPSLLLLSKGKAYAYKGRRTVDDISEFARGGYQIHQPETVQPPAGIFGEIGYVYRHAYKQAGQDLRKGNFFTIDVFLTFLPLLFVILLVVVLFAPTPGPKKSTRRPISQAPVTQSGKEDEGEEEEEEEENTNKDVDGKKTKAE